MSLVLDAAQLSRVFGKGENAFTAVDRVSLRVSSGEIHALLGPNGAGKTTTVQMCSTLLTPTGGSLTVNGVDAIAHPQRARRHVGLALGGENGFYPRASARDNLLFFADVAGVSGRTRRHEVEHALARVELADAATRPVQEFSRGMKQRLHIARALLGSPALLLLDEPTNHLDADSILWLRDFLKNFSGGLMVISHDVDLMELVVNRVFYLDANRCVIDQYNMGWKNYLTQREQDEHRRKRERANAQKKANALMEQANKMRAKATKAVAAQQMIKRAEKLLRGLEDERQSDKVAAIRFPDPAPCGKTPLSAQGLSKSYGSLEIFTDVDLAIDRGSRVVVLGLNGAGKTTLLRMLAGSTKPDTGEVVYGHGAKLGYFAQEHEILDGDRTVFENMKSAAPDLDDTRVRTILGSFLFSGDDVDKPAGVLSGGEKTRLSLATLVASSANVLLLDEPTNNLDPASREEILNALKAYQGAIVMVSHDEGAVEALDPERVLLLPDAVEDLWSKEYQDLISLA